MLIRKKEKKIRRKSFLKTQIDSLIFRHKSNKKFRSEKRYENKTKKQKTYLLDYSIDEKKRSKVYLF